MSITFPERDIPDPDGVPAYVWRILFALLFRKPLDLKGVKVPAAVEATINRYHPF